MIKIEVLLKSYAGTELLITSGQKVQAYISKCSFSSFSFFLFCFHIIRYKCLANQENTQRADRPVLAYIYQDYNGRHLKAAELNLEDKEIGPVLWSHDSIEAEASIVIPVPQPCGGCLVIGRETISYYKGMWCIENAQEKTEVFMLKC